MFGSIKGCLQIAVILTGFCWQQCDATNCEVTENFKFKNPTEGERCNQWKIPTPPKNQAILIRLNERNSEMPVNLSRVGAIIPKYIGCVIYRPKKCVVSPRNCEDGNVHVLLDTKAVSVKKQGHIGMSHKFLSCSDAVKHGQQSPTTFLVWTMAVMAITTFLIVIIMLVAKLCNRSDNSSKTSRVKTAAETNVDSGHLAMVKVETHRKQSTDVSDNSQRASNEPNQEVTAFDTKTKLDRTTGDDRDDGDSSEERGPTNERRGGIASVTERILKQGGEKQMTKQELSQKDSENQEGDEESSSEESEEDDESEKNEEEQDKESSSSSDGEAYGLSDLEGETKEDESSEKGEEEDEKKEEDDEPPEIPKKMMGLKL